MRVLVCDPVSPKGIALLQQRPEFEVVVLPKRLPEAELLPLAEHRNHDTAPRRHADTSIPFMQLPTEIPARLKQLIPYNLALTLRCVPVGRNHHSLTVAMANPANHEDIRQLQMITHMVIFPVSCEEEALNALLEQPW